MAKIAPNGATVGISGKVTASTIAGGLSMYFASKILGFITDHWAWLASVFAGEDGADLKRTVIALIAAGVTFGAGYLAHHVPPGMVNDFRDFYGQPNLSGSTPTEKG